MMFEELGLFPINEIIGSPREASQLSEPTAEVRERRVTAKTRRDVEPVSFSTLSKNSVFVSLEVKLSAATRGEDRVVESLSPNPVGASLYKDCNVEQTDKQIDDAIKETNPLKGVYPMMMASIIENRIAQTQSKMHIEIPVLFEIQNEARSK